MGNTLKTAMVIEKDDESFKKINGTLVTNGFLVKRYTDYTEAIAELEAREYERVVCTFKLTDKDSFEFIGKVKQLPYNHPNLLVQTSSLLQDQEKINKFNSLISSEKYRKELDDIFKSPFDELKSEERPFELPNYLEFSKKNPMPVKKTYIYDFNETEILLGVWPYDANNPIGNELVLNACIRGKIDELVLSGTFSEVNPFDENRGEVTYLSFTLDQEGSKLWKKYLDLYSKEDIEIEELLINMRGH